MRIDVNRNNVWTDLFVETLLHAGVKHAVISPGSRSTPLTISFAKNKKIKKYVVIDERSGGFFALGLAKKTGSPVALVTTSGTAVGELYPAVIEAFNSRVPLIVCTADRPPALRNSGANQTINQENFYSNHIRSYYDTGLPALGKRDLLRLVKRTFFTLEIGLLRNRGPVHFNLPFEKPLEPSAFTNKIDPELLASLKAEIGKLRKWRDPDLVISLDILSYFKKVLNKYRKGIFFLGWDDYPESFIRELSRLSLKCGYPIFADGCADFRFERKRIPNLIKSPAAFFDSNFFGGGSAPEVIIQFGSPPTSVSALNFMGDSAAEKILINRFGDLKDPSRSFKRIIEADPLDLCKKLNSSIVKLTAGKSAGWITECLEFDDKISGIRMEKIRISSFPFEGRVINETLDMLNDYGQIFVSNSLPVRDFDSFAFTNRKGLKIFSNRGASGIDGTISTAAGISAVSKRPTVMFAGDLAFFHDLNGLWLLKTYSIPLIIILIDNNGGGIFELLPVHREKKYFGTYFKTPHNLDFSKFVRAFNGNYYAPSSRERFRLDLKRSLSNRGFSVIHLKVNSEETNKIRSEIKAIRG